MPVSERAAWLSHASLSGGDARTSSSAARLEGSPRAATKTATKMRTSFPLSILAKGAAGAAAGVALWEIARGLHWVDPRDLPSFVAVLRSAGAELWRGELLSAVLATLFSWGLGLATATLLGIAAGIALATMPRLERVTRPIVEFLRPIPSVALIPIALLTLGIGLEMQLVMIAFASVWPILFSTKAGVEGIDPRFRETGRIFGLGRLGQVVRITTPAATPSIATGLRTASAIALVLAITVEMLTGRPGIGFYLQNARLNGLVAEMWAAIFVTGALGFLINAAFLTLERCTMPWSVGLRDR
jgi:ABC-type nitrate/sulfonate/bicarbonate transport system permease component